MQPAAWSKETAEVEKEENDEGFDKTVTVHTIMYWQFKMAKDGNILFPSHWRQMTGSINNAGSLFKIQLFPINMKACEQILSLDAHFMWNTFFKKTEH